MCAEFSLGWLAGRRHPCDRGCRLGWRPKDKVLHVWRSAGNGSVLHCSTLVCDILAQEFWYGSPFNPCVQWDRALHGASWPEKGLVVRGREVGLTVTSATATSSGTASWRPALQVWKMESRVTRPVLAIQQGQKLLVKFGWDRQAKRLDCIRCRRVCQ